MVTATEDMIIINRIMLDAIAADLPIMDEQTSSSNSAVALALGYVAPVGPT